MELWQFVNSLFSQQFREINMFWQLLDYCYVNLLNLFSFDQTIGPGWHSFRFTGRWHMKPNFIPSLWSRYFKQKKYQIQMKFTINIHAPQRMSCLCFGLSSTFMPPLGQNVHSFYFHKEYHKLKTAIKFTQHIHSPQKMDTQRAIL